MNRIIAFFALILLAAAPYAHAATDNLPAAADYCVKKGGVVQTRVPEYGTNGGTPLVLSGQKQFCAFTAKNGGSSIYVVLSTLVTKQPTLAALAYYAEVPFNGSSCQGSPGSCYCSQIGGTDLFGGINAAGGGWVLTTDSNDVLDACIFPDLSIIDSYGLFYHSAGIVRGKDLSKVLRYKNPNG
jgi:putative hemolysin